MVNHTKMKKSQTFLLKPVFVLYKPVQGSSHTFLKGDYLRKVSVISGLVAN